MMTQISEGFERQPEGRVGEQYPIDDPNKIGQRIQRHYWAMPSVIPVQGKHSLKGRVMRLTVDRLPLLAAIQRRWLPTGAGAWSNWSDLPYVHLSSAPELVSSLPLEPPPMPSDAEGTGVAANQTARQRTVQTHPIVRMAGGEAPIQRDTTRNRRETVAHLPIAVPPVTQQENADTVLPAESPGQQQVSDSSGARAQASNLTTQSGLTEPTIRQRAQRAMSSGHTASKASHAGLAPTLPNNLGVAIVQRHLSKPTSEAIASRVPVTVSTALDAQQNSAILRRPEAGISVRGEATNQSTPDKATTPESEFLISPMAATAKNQSAVTPITLPAEAALSTAADSVGTAANKSKTTVATPIMGNPTLPLETSVLGKTIAERHLSGTIRRTNQPSEISSVSEPLVQSERKPVLRRNPSSSTSETNALSPLVGYSSTTASSPAVKPSRELGAAIGQRHLKGTVSQPMQSPIITPSRQLETRPREVSIQRSQPIVPDGPDSRPMQMSSLSTAGASSPLGRGGASQDSPLVQRTRRGPTSQAEQHQIMPQQQPVQSTLQSTEPSLAQHEAFVPRSHKMAADELIQDVESAATSSTIGRVRELGAAIVQRTVTSAASPTLPLQTTTSLPTSSSVSYEEEPVLRRNRAISATGMDASTPAIEGGLTAMVSSAIARTGGNLERAIVQRQRREATNESIQRQSVPSMVTQPTTSPVEPVLRRNEMLPSNAELPSNVQRPSNPTANLPITPANLPVAGGRSNARSVIAQQTIEGTASYVGQAMATVLPSAQSELGPVEPILRRTEHRSGSSEVLHKARISPSTPANTPMPTKSLPTVDVGGDLGAAIVQRYLGSTASQATQPVGTMSGLELDRQPVEPILRMGEPPGTIDAAKSGSLRTGVTPWPESPAVAMPVSNRSNSGDGLVQSQPNGPVSWSTAQPVYAPQRRSSTPAHIENLGLAIIQHQQAGPSGQIAERILRSRQAAPLLVQQFAVLSRASDKSVHRMTSPVQLSAPNEGVSFTQQETMATFADRPVSGQNLPLPAVTSIVRTTALPGISDGSRPEPMLPGSGGESSSARYASDELYHPRLTVLEEFNSVPLPGEGATIHSELPLAYARVQAKELNNDADSAFMAPSRYANASVAPLLQRATSAPAAESPMARPTTPSTDAVEPSTTVERRTQTAELDLEHLANEVYTIIERRLLIERESMGL